MKELTEQEKQSLKKEFSHFVEAQGKTHPYDFWPIRITPKHAQYILSLLSKDQPEPKKVAYIGTPPLAQRVAEKLMKDQPVAGADDEHLFYVEYWAGRLLGNEQDWEIAKEIIDSQKLYASVVATKLARENGELKSALEDILNHTQAARVVDKNELKKIDIRLAPLSRKAFAKIWNRAEELLKNSKTN